MENLGSAANSSRPMQRHRCGEYEDGKFFGRSRAVMSKGRWGMLWRPLALWGPETTRFLADAGGPSRSYVQSGAAEVAEQLAGASVPRWSRPDPFALHRMASTAINRLFPHSEARSWEREFESISLQQTVCLLSRSRFRRSENPAFPRGSGQLALTTRSAETRRCFDIAPDASNISSGHIPVPQCR